MAMANRKGEKAGQENRFISLAIMTAVLALPGVGSGRIGWLAILVPLPVFYYLTCLGKKEGTILVRNAILISCGLAIIFGSLPLLIFTLTMVPLGYVFFKAAREQKNPVQAGFNGIIILGAAWFLFWAVTGIIYRVNPYENLLATLDEGMTAMETLYQETYELPEETRKSISTAFAELRTLIPRVLPALLTTGLVCIAWMNLALGNWLLKRKDSSLTPWNGFRQWRLPDKLVWGWILGGSLLIFSGPLSTLGLNILLVWGAIYSIQGLAVLVSLLARWTIPLPFKVIIYGLIILQSYGIILLSIVGLVDVWADFRHLVPKDDEKKKNSDTDIP